MKLRKLAKCSLAAALIFGSISFISGCNKDNETTKKIEQEKTYDLYVQYMNAKGDAPLTYEQWLASIKGEKGDKGDKGDSGDNAIAPKVRINETTNYWEISTDNGTTWTSTRVKATGAEGEKGDPGDDAIAPQVRINETTNEWEISTDNCLTWISTEIKATPNNGYKALYKETVKSVVMVKVQRKTDYQMIAVGSGVVAFEENDSAYVITNAHVLKDMTQNLEVEIFFSDEEGFLSGKSEIATIIGKDLHEDVAILKINKSDKYKVATLGDSSKVRKGDFIYTIGTTNQYFNHTTVGTIANYNVKTGIDNSNTGVTTPVYAILFDAPINKGSSGGALFDSNGKVIGITSINYNELDGVYGALPINHFIKVARHLLSSGTTYSRPILNLKILSINEMGTSRALYGISSSITSGVYVENSIESSIMSGSIITEVNNISVNSSIVFEAEILKYNAGDTITLTLVNKDGLNSRKVSVTLH